jgi:hypothetical protein
MRLLDVDERIPRETIKKVPYELSEWRGVYVSTFWLQSMFVQSRVNSRNTVLPIELPASSVEPKQECPLLAK